jgi:hypothetical protein
MPHSTLYILPIAIAIAIVIILPMALGYDCAKAARFYILYYTAHCMPMANEHKARLKGDTQHIS